MSHTINCPSGAYWIGNSDGSGMMEYHWPDEGPSKYMLATIPGDDLKALADYCWPLPEDARKRQPRTEPAHPEGGGEQTSPGDWSRMFCDLNAFACAIRDRHDKSIDALERGLEEAERRIQVLIGRCARLETPPDALESRPAVEGKGEPISVVDPTSPEGIEVLASSAFAKAVEQAQPKCRGCGKALDPANISIADGCPCNNPRGINHGLVPKHVCTCRECDPAQTGSVRKPVPPPAPIAGKSRGMVVAAKLVNKGWIGDDNKGARLEVAFSTDIVQEILASAIDSERTSAHAEGKAEGERGMKEACKKVVDDLTMGTFGDRARQALIHMIDALPTPSPAKAAWRPTEEELWKMWDGARSEYGTQMATTERLGAFAAAILARAEGAPHDR